MAGNQVPLSDDDQRSLWLQEYYDVLNQAGDFQKALKALFLLSRKYPRFDDNPPPAGEREYEEEMSHQGVAIEPKKYPDPELEKAFEEFGRRWKLPERCWVEIQGSSDLWDSLRLWRCDPPVQERPRLMASGVVTEVHVRSVKIKLEAEEFSYDASINTYDWAKAEVEKRIERIRKSALVQIKHVQDQARLYGWPELHPRHTNPEERRYLASRVYRRAVLQKTWAQIAKDDHRDVRSVMDSTQQLAGYLGIPLPHKRGRRRKI